MGPKFIQDPDALLDYTVDTTRWLVPDDHIVHIAFIVDDGLAVLSTNIADSTIFAGREACAASIWLFGGVTGTTYSITLRIVTDRGRTNDFTFHVTIKET